MRYSNQNFKLSELINYDLLKNIGTKIINFDSINL